MILLSLFETHLVVLYFSSMLLHTIFVGLYFLIMRNLKIFIPLYSILSQVGLQGEFLKFYSEQNESSGWVELSPDGIPSTFTWYKVIMIC